MKKITKILAFGDSQLAGAELAQWTIPEVDDKMLTQFPNLRIRGSGRLCHIDPGRPEPTYRPAARRFGVSLIPEDEAYDVTELDLQLSFPNYLSEKLGIPCYNYAIGGSSINAIYSQFLTHMDEIDEHTLVIFSLTYLNRDTRYKQPAAGCNPRNNRAHNKGIVNIVPGTAMVPDTIADYTAYLELGQRFGSDYLSEYIGAHAILTAITSNSPNYIFVDTSSLSDSKANLELFQCEEINDDNYFHAGMINKIHEDFNQAAHQDNLRTTAGALADLIRNKSYFGHWNLEVNRAFVDNALYPYVKNTYIIDGHDSDV